jgi:hypothetical protein
MTAIDPLPIEEVGQQLLSAADQIGREDGAPIRHQLGLDRRSNAMTGFEREGRERSRSSSWWLNNVRIDPYG